MMLNVIRIIKDKLIKHLLLVSNSVFFNSQLDNKSIDK